MTGERGARAARHLALLLAAGLSGAGAANALVCTVPSANTPTIAAAVRNLACTTVEVAAGTQAEHLDIDRDLVVQGAGPSSTTIAGRVRVFGAGVEVELAALRIDGAASEVAGCWPQALAVGAGARVSSVEVRVVNTAAAAGSCRLFADGFDYGSFLAWSSSTP